MNKKFLSGSTLKWIALITMIIDHIGAILIPAFYSKGIGNMYVDWTILYQVCRWIGRFSFPLYCFLLVEGFVHTANRNKYFYRMFLFAVISEIPFDYAVYGEIWYLNKQNIFFELLLGIVLMHGSELLFKIVKNQVLQGLYVVIWWLGGMLTAHLLQTDYGMLGIFSIGILYLFRYVREYQLLGGALSFYWEFPAPLGLLFAYFYNGQRGRQCKYAFYLIYPLHLALFGLVKYLISGI